MILVLRGLLVVLTLLLGSLSQSGATAQEVASSRSNAAVEPTLRVATYNVCRPLVCPRRAGPWSVRKRAILRTIRAADPDLLLLQEVDDLDGTASELGRDLARLGLRHANAVQGRCRPVWCSNQVFYHPRAVRPLGVPGATGNVGMSALVSPGLFRGGVRDRPIGYSFFRSVATGEAIAAVSLHLTQRFAGDARFGPARSARLAVARALPNWIELQAQQLGVPGARFILAGDVNSYPGKEPDGPQRIFDRAGYINADRASRRFGTHFGTINLTRMTAGHQGFPLRIPRYRRGGPRIDIIVTKGFPRAISWGIAVRLKSGGRFVKRFQGSDHNLVQATLRLGG